MKIRWILLCAVCLLFSGCLKILPADKNPEVTLDAVIDANYVTTITAGHQYLIVTSDGSTTAFFLHNGEIAQCEDGESFSTGTWSGVTFTVHEDGTVTATSPMDEFAGDPPAVPLTDSRGRYYENNAFLLYPLLDETADVKIAAEYNGKDITVFAELDSGEHCTYTVDRKTLLIREYCQSWNARTFQVTAADEAYVTPTGAGAALTDAGQTRTLTYHTYLSGHEKDYVFEIPGSWAFSLGAYGDIRFFGNEGQTDEIDNLIPADGGDYEVWVSDAKG